MGFAKIQIKYDLHKIKYIKKMQCYNKENEEILKQNQTSLNKIILQTFYGIYFKSLLKPKQNPYQALKNYFKSL